MLSATLPGTRFFDLAYILGLCLICHCRESEHINTRMPTDMTKAQRSLTLLLPQLPLSDGHPSYRMAAFERLVGCGKTCAQEQVRIGLDAELFRLFGANIDEIVGDLPVAAVTRVHDFGVIDNEWWMRADPVHLVPRADELVLAHGREIGLGREEAQSLAREIMGLYAEDGWVLRVATPDRWYLRPGKEAPRLGTMTPKEIAGRHIQPYLPSGPDAHKWQTLMNEIQILLLTAPVNTERERRGQLPVNSLWFWGGGQLPGFDHCDWVALWSANPLALGLARLGEIRAYGSPASAAQWFADAVSGEHLVVLDQGFEALAHEGIEAWSGFLASLERDWFVPLEHALRQRSLAHVTLVTDTGLRIRILPEHVQHAWRQSDGAVGHASQA